MPLAAFFTPIYFPEFSRKKETGGLVSLTRSRSWCVQTHSRTKPLKEPASGPCPALVRVAKTSSGFRSGLRTGADHVLIGV